MARTAAMKTNGDDALEARREEAAIAFVAGWNTARAVTLKAIQDERIGSRVSFELKARLTVDLNDYLAGIE